MSFFCDKKSYEWRESTARSPVIISVLTVSAWEKNAIITNYIWKIIYKLVRKYFFPKPTQRWNKSLNWMNLVYSSKEGEDRVWFPKTECGDDFDKSLFCGAEKLKSFDWSLDLDIVLRLCQYHDSRLRSAPNLSSVTKLLITSFGLNNALSSGQLCE